MKKYLQIVGAIEAPGCSSKKPDGQTAFKAFAPDGIPFVVADFPSVK